MSHYQIITTIFTGASFFIALYVITRMGALLGLVLRTRIITGLIFATVTASHQYLLALGSTTALPDIHLYLILSDFCTVFTLMALLPLLVLDLLLLIRRLLIGNRKSGPIFSFLRSVMGWGLTLGVGAFAVTGTYNAIKLPTVDEVELKIPQLAPEFEGMTIVQLSDLHTSPLFTRERMMAIVSMVNILNPDLVLETGDLADGNAEMRRYDVDPLFDIKSRLGHFGITGNHEYLVDFDSWIHFFNEHETPERLLRNQHVVIGYSGRRILICGLSDESATRYSRYEGPNLDKAMAGAGDADLRILLAHQPRGAHQYAAHPAQFQLMLSGHTHAGLINMLKPLFAVANNGFVQGMYQLGNMMLYVNSGTDMWAGFAARLGTHNEITRFTLKRAR